MTPDGTLHTWFRDQALAQPDAPALEVAGRTLSYRELLDVSERLAARLRAAVGGPPTAVGLLASRSLAAYAGYLAALRLGAVVVPLNPRFPLARNELICSKSTVDVLVLDHAQTDLTVGTAVPLVGDRWDADLPAAGADPYQGTPDDVAYTLFTSGSTGVPKGVPIRHRNVGPYLRHCVERYAVGPGCRLSQTFDLTFDPSVFDLFVAWSAGATLVVPQPDEILQPARFVRDKRITHWFSVPSVVSLARRMRQLRPNSMPDLRWSLFAGEQLTLDQAAAWAAAAPGSTVENLYGPTELTITCVGYRLAAEVAAWPRTSNGTVPIGRPYPHLEGIALAEDGRVGDDGELCVRGPQRFDGYLDPAHDVGRFVTVRDGLSVPSTAPTPASTDWYRTGDRVRLEDGAWVHVGRIDDQIKVSGYRIELAEIEAVLRGHPGVLDAVVLALPDGNDSVALQALYCGDGVEEADVAMTLQRQLPSYMLPGRYLRVDGFPVNASGKVDRSRLAAELTSGDRRD
ncbi:amino acid adenylation domain-containing protein [Dactylosporangium vinaceum]|uniref:Amino acid adenylation domain-containing protein n=1 Tax=Dactylosporangium vinaceum TaxID=53362 RepID=A0ABV5M3L2_9ACTN|nr:amino acid adenylation domain-containing protein [Dactylosporangium vinaceum]UAB94414.1 amino acid adenylation domain-containing protein [Dactylosporangium vinaceum]